MELEDILRVATLLVTLLLLIGQLRMYRMVRNTAKQSHDAFDDLNEASAELVAAARRNFEKMRIEMEEGIKARLDGRLVSLDEERRNRKPA